MPAFVDKEGRGGWVNPGDEWKIPYFINCEVPPEKPPEKKEAPGPVEKQPEAEPAKPAKATKKK